MDAMFRRMEKEIKDNYEINREETLGLRRTMNTQNKKLGDTVYRLDNMLKFVDSVEERVIKNTQTTEKLSDTVDNTMQNLRELSESLAATETDLREHAEMDEQRQKKMDFSSRMLRHVIQKVNEHDSMLEHMGRNSVEEHQHMSFVLDQIDKIQVKLDMPRVTPETASVTYTPYQSGGEEGNGELSFEYSDSDQEETRRRDSSSPEYRDANPYPDDSGSDDNWDEGSHVVRQGPDGSFNFAQQ